MVIDTSAFVAIVLGEPEAAMFDEQLRLAPSRLVSVASWLEFASVLTLSLIHI